MNARIKPVLVFYVCMNAHIEQVLVHACTHRTSVSA